MKQIRRTNRLNIDLPGVVEMEDPNRFLPERLKPVEEFRHTPVVPIEEKKMKEFKEQIENRKNKFLQVNMSFDKFL